MKQVEILYESDTSTLEDKLNEWLKEHGDQMIDIKFALYGTHSNDPCAMIIYETSHAPTPQSKEIEGFDKFWDELEALRGLHPNYTGREPARAFILSYAKVQREEGRRKAEIDESIKRYNQAKEDGTLDKHFPKIGQVP